MQTLLGFLQFIEEKHLYDVAHEGLRMSRELDLPIMRLFAHLSEEELIAMSEQSLRAFIHSVEDGSYEQKQSESLQLWEEDRIPGVPKESIQPSDLVLGYVAQKRSFYRFIPCYTTDSRLAIEIVTEMDKLYMGAQDAAINLLFKMRQKVEERLRESEEKIRRLNLHLEQNIAELENVNTELESFSYSVSHDLRAPLRAIHNYTKIVFNDNREKLGADSQHHMERIMANAKKMSQLIDDLLSFSRIGKKELQRSELDMNILTELALRTIRINFPKSTAEIVVKPLGTIMGDGLLIEQVLYNLLNNAVKYSAKKEKPQIEVGSEKKEGFTQFYVKDNGVGFDMKFYDKLFGVFQRLHAAEEYEGTGVGLAIVRRIITRHGGKVWAEAEPDKGAVFYFSLPDDPEINTSEP